VIGLPRFNRALLSFRISQSNCATDPTKGTSRLSRMGRRIDGWG
jgi:hypothetical protein